MASASLPPASARRPWSAYLGPLFVCLAAAAFCVVLMARLRSLWAFTVDDTFITLEYAKHVVEGYGPVWNVGGPLVEGYTTVLWLLVLTVAQALGVSGVWAAKLGSALCLFGSVGLSAWLAFLLARVCDVRARWLAATLPFAVGCAYWKFAVHGVSGMETTLTACLLTGFFCFAVRFEDGALPRDARIACLLALCATLARPEMAVGAGGGLVTLAVLLAPPARTVWLRAFVRWTLLPGLVYFALRYAAFGLLFPLPFYVKATGHAALAGLPEIVEFFGDFLKCAPFLLFAALASAYLRWRRVAPVFVGCALLALFFVFPNHIMGFESRYLMPIWPGLLGLSGFGCALLLDLALRRAPNLRMARLSLGFAWCVPALLTVMPFPDGQALSDDNWRSYAAGLERAHISLARSLKAPAAGKRRPVIAMLDVGAVAYYSDWTVVDTFGLNDARVALSQRKDMDYVFSYRPEAVVFVSARPDSFVPVFPWEAPLYTEAQQRGYVFSTNYVFEHDYHLRVLTLPGLQATR